MSWRHSKAIGELDLKDPTAKLVGFALAHHANEYSGQCWPGIKRLAMFTGLSERSVYNGLRVLEERQVVITRRRPNQTSVYTLALQAAPPIDQYDGVPAPAAGPGVQEVQVGGAPAAPKQSIEQTRDARVIADDWQPRPETIAAIKTAENLSEDVIEAEREVFILRNQRDETIVKNPDAAFRLWCRRRAGLAHPPPAPRRKGKAAPDERSEREKLEAYIALCEQQLADRHIAKDRKTTISGYLAQARAQLAALPEEERTGT